MTQLRSMLICLPIALAMTACSDEPSSDDAAADEGTTGNEARAALYYDDVRPILAEHCNSCHTEGAVAPFTLEDYDSVREWGPAVLAAVQSRSMPPFGVTNDGSCNTFEDARWLSDEEIETIATWVDGGYEEGDASLPPPARPQTTELSGQIQTLSLPQYEPKPVEGYGGFEDYHCFKLELELDEPRFITGFDVAPGNAKLVHHVLGFRVDPSFLGNGEQMDALDELSPDVSGWDCFGAAGEDVIPGGVPVTWAPGVGATEFPEGVGIRVDPGDVIVVQVHYNLVDGGGSDATEVELQMTDGVEREAFQILWDPFLFSAQFGNPEQLPAGQEAASFSWDESFSEMMQFDSSGGFDSDEFEVLALLPHMHERGLTMSVDLQRGDDMMCGARVDRWNFDWQQTYFLEQPFRAGRDDRFHVTCEWNTMGDDQPTMPGFGTDDEMCLLGVMFTPL
ncbi:MAG: hypothetical protein K0V04_22130 [Deltaproteobacteria bacterium]|nr:hypothetical protein [Deltaproteobacteria bacterium]